MKKYLQRINPINTLVFITSVIVVMQFLGYQKYGDIRNQFQSNEDYVLEKINSIYIGATKEFMVDALGKPVRLRFVTATTSEELYNITGKDSLAANAKLIYKTPDNTVIAVIIKNYCSCFNVSIPSISDFDFKKKFYLSDKDSELGRFTGRLDYKEYFVRDATAPTIIYEQYYLAHPGDYYNIAFGYQDYDTSYNDANSDLSKIKDENDASDPFLIKFRNNVAVNIIGYWKSNFNGFSDTTEGVIFDTEIY